MGGRGASATGCCVFTPKRSVCVFVQLRRKQKEREKGRERQLKIIGANFITRLIGRDH